MTATPAMPPASAEQRSFEQLLELMLTTDGYDRVRAFTDAINRGMGGMTVADHRCGRRGQPEVRTLYQLMKHLVATDGPRQVERRGYRLHTPINVEPWDPESPGQGPALGRGPA